MVRNVKLPIEIDAQLEAACPPHLRGPRRTAQRVIYAIDKALRGEKIGMGDAPIATPRRAKAVVR